MSVWPVMAYNSDCEEGTCEEGCRRCDPCDCVRFGYKASSCKGECPE